MDDSFVRGMGNQTERLIGTGFAEQHEKSEAIRYEENCYFCDLLYRQCLTFQTHCNPLI